jgi:hypothetical protein
MQNCDPHYSDLNRRRNAFDDIIAAVAETDIAELTTAEQFKWLLRSGHAVWMFGALDEFCSGGREGAAHSPRVERFVAALKRSSEVAALARLPFYCSVMLAHFHAYGDMPHDELRGAETTASGIS